MTDRKPDLDIRRGSTLLRHLASAGILHAWEERRQGRVTRYLVAADPYAEGEPPAVFDTATGATEFLDLAEPVGNISDAVELFGGLGASLGETHADQLKAFAETLVSIQPPED